MQCLQTRITQSKKHLYACWWLTQAVLGMQFYSCAIPNHWLKAKWVSYIDFIFATEHNFSHIIALAIYCF